MEKEICAIIDEILDDIDERDEVREVFDKLDDRMIMKVRSRWADIIVENVMKIVKENANEPVVLLCGECKRWQRTNELTPAGRLGICIITGEKTCRTAKCNVKGD